MNLDPSKFNYKGLLSAANGKGAYINLFLVMTVLNENYKMTDYITNKK